MLYNVTLEQVLLEAKKVSINANKDLEKEESADYSVGEDTKTEADDSNQNNDQPNESDEDSTNDYTNSDEETPDNTDDADSGTDYTGGEATDTEEDKTSDDNEEEDTSTPSDNENSEDEQTDDTGDDDSSEDSVDYTSDTGDDNTEEGNQDDSYESDDNTDDSSSDSGDNTESSVEKDKKVQQFLLLRQFNRLYFTLKDIIRTLDTFKRGNIILSAIQTQANKNFNKIAILLFRYITIYFNNMSYEYNLYVYNYLMEAIKINIEMLNNVSNKEEVIY